MLNGRARISAIDQDGCNFLDDVGTGDIWYFPPGIPHLIQGLEEGCEFLLVFDDGLFLKIQRSSLLIGLPILLKKSWQRILVCQ